MWIKWTSQFGISNLHKKMICSNTILSLWAGDSLYLPITWRRRVLFCFCLLPLTVSFCSLPGRKVAPSTLSNSCSCSSSCPLIHMLPAFPVIQVCLKYPLPQEAFLACPFLNWSHVSSSRWLGIHCLSWVTGRAHLISLWERESCMIHLCALKGHMQW